MAEPTNDKAIGAALVVGGGIAGVQAALDLADCGVRVYLIEREPAIGGKMAQLDKTFPTNDCAMCILSPKLVEAGRHRNIEILTTTELTTLEGQAGDFTATVLRRARYVDVDKCTSCDDCTPVCPVQVPDEFNEGLTPRKAIHRPYPQAVPSAFAIDKVGCAPCTAACPAGVSAQGYIALIRQRRYAEALRLIRERIPFASVCGRTCHHPCEGQCTRRYVDEPVAIQALKRFVTDQVYLGHLPPPAPVPRARPQQIAIVGSGPAGLTAAQDLIKMGYGVTVFEALPVAGGMMSVGIPEYRLPRDVLHRDIADILALGVDLRLNTPIRDPLALRDEGYDAVYLAVGVYGQPRLGIEGEELDGVISAISLLRNVNLGQPNYVGERVAVVGGGITAVDAATTALRLGAREVHLIYRRGRGEIPAYGWELDEAEAEGVKVVQRSMPLRILGDDGRVIGLECAETEAWGRQTPKPVPGTGFTLEVDTVIRALGQSSDLWHLEAAHGDWLGDPQTLATDHPGIFATPGRVPGAGFIINAIAQGHQAAASIHRYFQGEPLVQPVRSTIPVAKWTRQEIEAKVKRGEIIPTGRQPRSLLPLNERVERFIEVDLGFTERQALVEAERCLNCGVCSECGECAIACKAGAVNYDDYDRTETLKAGTVILAPGYEPYNAEQARELGYGRYANVVTSLQFERLLSASGPTEGHITRLSDHAEPQRIAFLQCVGSRDQDHDYCSSVCCMYATKEAMLALDHVPGVECHIFQIDMRAFSKGFDAYFERGKELGIHYHRCKISGLKEDPKSRQVLIDYVGDDGKLRQQRFDLVVLSLGMEKPAGADVLAQVSGIELDEYGFCKTKPLHPVETTRPGVYVCGAFAEPKDIPDSVIQAGGAAAAALATIGQSRGTLVSPAEYPPEIQVSPEDEARVGVFICSCGSNIAGVVDVAEVTEYAATLPNVCHAENTMYTCSADSLKLIQDRIREKDLNRVIVSSCTPRTHEPIFRDTIREAGLNPYLFDMANIRDQDSWVHAKWPELATEKAKDLTRMAVARSRRLAPLYTQEQSLSHRALIIGGGVAGMTAALNLAEQGYDVTLVEREEELGGQARQLFSTCKGGDPQTYVRQLIASVVGHPRVEVLTGHDIIKSSGFVGNFKSTLRSRTDPTQRLIEHGVTLVATGGREHRGAAYGLDTNPQVITQGDLEERLSTGSIRQEGRSTVVMLQCIGPWDEVTDQDQDEPDFYCSRICCSVAAKNALWLKEKDPNTEVFVLFSRDIRTYGFQEALYTRAREAGVVFLRYKEGTQPRVSTNGRLEITVQDEVLGQPITLAPDLLVLSEAIVPAEGSRELAELFKFSCTLEGFFLEAHVKLQPVDFPAEGVFLAGTAHYPKLLDETIAQAGAAAARAASILSKDKLEVGGVVAVVDPAKCTACLTCVRLCPFGAAQIDPTLVGVGEIVGAAEITAAACRGCGLCPAECPAKAIQLQHFTDDQVLAKEEALFEAIEAALTA